jgi:hypothetical protein
MEASGQIKLRPLCSQDIHDIGSYTGPKNCPGFGEERNLSLLGIETRFCRQLAHSYKLIPNA